MYDVVIIGAGIAGLTAAIYVRRSNKTVLVLEGQAYGGQIINTLQIENWPGDYGVSGVDLMQKIYKQATELGAEVEFEEVGVVEKVGEDNAIEKLASQAKQYKKPNSQILNAVRSLIKFDKPGDTIYFVQLMKRDKDNPGQHSPSNAAQYIKNYFFKR